MKLYKKVLFILITVIIFPSVLLIYSILNIVEKKGEVLLSENLLKSSQEAVDFFDNKRDEYFIKAKEIIDENKMEKLTEEFDRAEIMNGYEPLDEKDKEKMDGRGIVTKVSFNENYVAYSFLHNVDKAQEKYIIVEKRLMEKEYLELILGKNNMLFAVIDSQGENKILSGNIYNSYGEKQRNSILSKDKIVRIVNNRENVFEKNVKAGERIYDFIYFPIIEDEGVTAIGAVGIDKSEIETVLNLLRENILMVIGISIILATISTFIISSMVIKPVEKIENYTKKVAKGNLDEMLILKSKDEFGNLARNIQRMVITLRENITKERELEKKIYEAEIRKEYIDEIERKNQEITKAMIDLTAAQEALLAREKFASLGEMAGGIAHELNNPLGAILNSVQLMKMDVEEIDSEGKKDMLESLQIIESATKKGKNIVSSLLNYSRRKTSHFSSIDLTDVVKETLLLLKHRLNNIEIIKEYDEKKPYMINGNIDGMIQIFTNLITNAIDAMEMGETENKKIIINLEQNNNGTTVRVRDFGPGIPEEIKSKIFDPFFTTKSVGKGTGLGLSIVMAIVRDHNGEIFLSHDIPYGTEFTLVLKKAAHER